MRHHIHTDLMAMGRRGGINRRNARTAETAHNKTTKTNAIKNEFQGMPLGANVCALCAGFWVPSWPHA